MEAIDNEKLSFADLPRELRDLVYQEILVTDHAISNIDNGRTSYSSAILYANKTTCLEYREAMQKSKTTLVPTVHRDIHIGQGSHSPRSRRHFRYAIFNVCRNLDRNLQHVFLTLHLEGDTTSTGSYSFDGFNLQSLAYFMTRQIVRRLTSVEQLFLQFKLSNTTFASRPDLDYDYSFRSRLNDLYSGFERMPIRDIAWIYTGLKTVWFRKEKLTFTSGTYEILRSNLTLHTTNTQEWEAVKETMRATRKLKYDEEAYAEPPTYINDIVIFGPEQ